jgi:hypothetical protein
MFYPDLATECQVDAGPCIRAIGWLEQSHQFPIGDVAPTFVVALRAHLKAPTQPVLAMGFHQCDLCDAVSKRVSGKSNVWIPTNEYIYVAPALIVHYIEEHRYRPPNEFIAAVMACPEQGSEAYCALINRFPDWQERMKQFQRKD